ncbi:MAG: Mut7-C RNAse domain-containing protein [Luteimonas sp.]
MPTQLKPALRTMLNQCEFRFYEELNAFLPPALRKRSFAYRFNGTPAVKDPIEALGVPHTEVDLILVDGASVEFVHRLRGGERVAVYPVFERFELAGVTRLRPVQLREPRFVLDVHLGRLARYMRLLGFDCLYRNDYPDEELVAISRDEHRIVLTRDTGLLKRAEVTHGAFVRAQDPRQQLREVLDRFQLHGRIAPFSRCGRCNGMLSRLATDDALRMVPPAVAQKHDEFRHCVQCGQVYWPGTHLQRFRGRLADVGIPAGAWR